MEYLFYIYHYFGGSLFMSRLEKAREKKRKGRKKFYILLIVVQVIVILAALISFLHLGR